MAETKRKFKLVKKDITKQVPCYGKKAKTGDVIELTGHMAQKAADNPDFQEVK